MNSSLTVLILVFILFNSSFFLYFSLWIFTFIPSSLFFCTHKPECVFHTDLLQLLPFSLLPLSIVSTFYFYFYMLCSRVIQSGEASCQLDAARQKSLQTTSHHMSLALSRFLASLLSLSFQSLSVSSSFSLY